MAAIRGAAGFDCNGKAYRLVVDINALIEAEEVSGLDTEELLEAVQRGRALKPLRALLFGALQREHPCTPIEAGNILSDAGPGVVGPALRKALAGAFPPATGDAPQNPPDAA